MLAADVAATKAVEEKIKTTDAALDEAVARYRAEATDGAAIDQFVAIWTQFREARDTKLIPEAEANDYAGAVAVLDEQTSPLSAQAMTELDTASQAEQAEAQMVSSSAEEVSSSVQTVAASSEQMTASISEIARNATDAAQVAAQAVESAQTASTTMTELGRSSEEVGNVIKVITSIAEQTNLLALNATIEAARRARRGKVSRWSRPR